MIDMRVRLVENMDPTKDAVRQVVPQMEALGRLILEDAQRACPVRTGNLRESGYWRINNTGSIPQLEVGFSADYAGFVSEGTSRMPGNAFFKSAIYKVRDMKEAV